MYCFWLCFSCCRIRIFWFMIVHLLTLSFCKAVLELQCKICDPACCKQPKYSGPDCSHLSSNCRPECLTRHGKQLHDSKASCNLCPVLLCQVLCSVLCPFLVHDAAVLLAPFLEQNCAVVMVLFLVQCLMVLVAVWRSHILR